VEKQINIVRDDGIEEVEDRMNWKGLRVWLYHEWLMICDDGVVIGF